MRKVDIGLFYEDVYSVVAEIPRGHVLTYGDIASLIGWPNHSRLVGRAMKDAPGDGSLPCHRVVSAGGRLSPCFPAQAALLAEEGISLSPSGKVNTGKYRWKISMP